MSESATGRRVGRRPTINDVATAAGVTKGTVSRYLNGRNWVSSETREAIRAAVDELGYVPNGVAQNLAKERTNCVALIFSEPTRMLSQNAIFGELLEAVTRELAERGVVAVLMFADRSDLKQRVLAYVKGRHVDGVVILSASADDSLVDELLQTGVPLAAAGPIGADRTPPIPYVGIDDAMGSRQAVGHLLEIGRQRVGIISGPLRDAGTEARLRAGAAVLEQAGLPVVSVSAKGFSAEAGYDATATIFEVNPNLDAVYVASDVLAIGAVRYLREKGRELPREVAVVGFDDIPTAATLDPPLSTIAPVPGEITIGGLIMNLIEGQEARSVRIPTRLVRRQTS